MSGTLPFDLRLKVYGAETGDVTVKYAWGYYETAYGKTEDRTHSVNGLHEIIEGHTEISYTEAWKAKHCVYVFIHLGYHPAVFVDTHSFLIPLQLFNPYIRNRSILSFLARSSTT